MAHIFRNKENKKLYLIEHLVQDIRHLNRNAFSGIYAYPYGWSGKVLTHTLHQKSMDEIEEFNPEKYVNNNFEIVSKI